MASGQTSQELDPERQSDLLSLVEKASDPESSPSSTAIDTDDTFEVIQKEEAQGYFAGMIGLIVSYFIALYAYFMSFLPWPSKKFIVGILTTPESHDCRWLAHALRSAEMKQHIDDVQCLCLSEVEEELKVKVASFSYLLFYHDGVSRDEVITNSISTLQQHFPKFEEKNMMVILGNVEDKETEEKLNKENISSKVFAFTTEEIVCHPIIKRFLQLGKLDQIKEILSAANTGTGWRPVGSKPTVGIFSRSSEDDYMWLETHLKSLQDGAWDVRPCYISNNGSRQFWDDVSQCTFAILYHTKKRGRINITDVTDSLYDIELKHLSTELGRNKVIVVVDDLNDSSYTEKHRILNSQRSIRNLAQELILFTEVERDPNYCITATPTPQDKADEESLNRKLQSMYELIITDKERMQGNGAAKLDAIGTEKHAHDP